MQSLAFTTRMKWTFNKKKTRKDALKTTKIERHAQNNGFKVSCPLLF